MLNQDAPPDLELLHDVELEMVRVSTAIDELSRDDADPQAVVSWVPSIEDPMVADESAVDPAAGGAVDVSGSTLD